MQAAADIQGWDAIEGHRTGTAGDRQTAQWLADLAAEAGAAPKLHSFPLHRWVPQECAITVGERRAEGVPLFDGGSTGPEGVAAPLVELPANTHGAIGLGVIGGEAGAAANRAFATARSAASMSALVAITKMNSTVPGLALQNADSFEAPFGPPVLQVASTEEAWLLAAARERSPAKLVVHVRTETAEGWNVAASVDGADRHLAPLVVVTPKSSWWTSTAERGGGIAAWLALLRHFLHQRPARQIVFIATSGHELGHLGLAHYLATNPTLAANAKAWLHLGANFAAAGSRVRLQAADEALAAFARNALAEAGAPAQDETPIGRRPGGEARNIHDIGGRYVSLLGSNAWFHHPADRWPTTVDVPRTERCIAALITIATQLATGD